MAILQKNMQKVQPVMDHCELNEHAEDCNGYVKVSFWQHPMFSLCGKLTEHLPVCGLLHDQLTRVPQKWPDEIQKNNGTHRIGMYSIFKQTGVCPEVPRAPVQEVVRNCDKCQYIDLAAMHWKIGRPDGDKNWSRVGMDMTHFGGWHS